MPGVIAGGDKSEARRSEGVQGVLGRKRSPSGVVMNDNKNTSI
jgi:hypothetical protein